MIQKLRALFLTRLLREKLLLVGIGIAAALYWISCFCGQAARSFGDVRHTTASLAEQKHWLSESAHVEAEAKQAASRFDPAKTLGSTELIAAVQAIARDTGLKNPNTGEATSLPAGQFTVNTVQFTVHGVDWNSLLAFYTSLQKRAPYIGLQSCSINAERGPNPPLDATMKISSVEITSGAE